MIKIHDIKPIVEIPDISIYLYYAMIFLLFLLGLFVLYILYKFFRPKAKTQEKQWYEKLQNLDFTDVKQTAYDISKYGRYLAKEERSIHLFEELSNSLLDYKYKKEVPKEFNNEIKAKYSIFMDSLDVR
ncbi:MAG: hypothetical protein CSA86_01075 [Arcobacter sp.]|nr:MAG: hypothetical protein CSA86_01075 [Arcobacter sp.]